MLRLVIADDEKQTRDCIIDFTDWSNNGIEIVGIASDGLEAYDVIQKTKPDIAILDIQMPGMSGLDVIENLRDQEAETVFIIVSSFDNFEYARKAIHLGVEEYLVKPFLPDEFLAAIYKASEQIRYLRGMTIASKENQQQGDLLFSKSHLALTSDVNYPVQEEKLLIEALQVDTDEAVEQRLQDFLTKVTEDNVDVKKQNSCCLICYVELYRFASLQNIVLSQPMPETQQYADEASLHLFLRNHLKKTCEVIFKTMGQLRSGSYLVKKAMEYIKQHYDEELSLERVAKSVYISPSYLSSLFRQSIGKTYTEYLNYVRIDKAKEIMLAEPHLKNYEVAARLGYSPKYFAQIFKQVEGITLSDFRQQCPL